MRPSNYKISEDAYLFVGDAGETLVLAAGSGVIDAVNGVGDVCEVVAGEVVYVAEQGADAAVVVFTVVGESVVDMVNGIEAGLVDAGGAAAGTISDIGNGVADGSLALSTASFRSKAFKSSRCYIIHRLDFRSDFVGQCSDNSLVLYFYSETIDKSRFEQTAFTDDNASR
jgi:hypothetical protein